MNCQKIINLLVPYLDNEVTTSEKVLIQAHLAECEHCQKELATFASINNQVKKSLHIQAEQATLSVTAWGRLLEVLPNEEDHESSLLSKWLKRFISSIDRGFHKTIIAIRTKKRNRFVFASVLGLVITISVIAFTPAALAQVVEAIHKIIIGEYSWVERVTTPIEKKSKDLPFEMWSVITEVTNFGGNVRPGVDPSILSTADIIEAQKYTDFPLQTPIYLPKKYVLKEIKLAPKGEIRTAIQIYTGPGKNIIVSQAKVGPVNYSVTMTDGPLQELSFDGHIAAWVDENSLKWDTDGFNYSVGGLDLSFDDALKIARSLR